MVSTYLVHHGYCATAEAFARGSGQPFEEEITSIKNRQSMSHLFMEIFQYKCFDDFTRLKSDDFSRPKFHLQQKLVFSGVACMKIKKSGPFEVNLKCIVSVFLTGILFLHRKTIAWICLKWSGIFPYTCDNWHQNYQTNLYNSSPMKNKMLVEMLKQNR